MIQRSLQLGAIAEGNMSRTPAVHPYDPPESARLSRRRPAAGFLLVLTSLLDELSGYAAVRVLAAPFIWLGTNSLAVFAGDILLQVSFHQFDGTMTTMMGQ